MLILSAVLPSVAFLMVWYVAQRPRASRRHELLRHGSVRGAGER
jgi:hypothetical protein